MRNTLIPAAAGLLWLLVPGPRKTAGQEIAAPVPTYKPAWEHKTADDGRDHIWQCLLFLPESRQLFALEQSLDGDTYRDGRFTLWQFAADGKAFNSVRIDKRPAELITAPGPGDILGLFPLDHEELLVIGAIDGAEREIEFIRLDSEGNRLRAKSLGKRLKYSISGAVLKSDKSVLLLGSDPEALAVATDLEGNIIWEQRYRRDARLKELLTAVIEPDGKTMLLVGRSGDWNEFGAGRSDIWLLRCDADGNRLEERAFPGHPLATSAFAGGKLAILCGDKSWIEYLVDPQGSRKASRMVIGSNLRTLSEVDTETVFPPSMSRAGDDRLALAGYNSPPTTLSIQEYDAAGELTRKLERPLNAARGIDWLLVAGGPTDVFTAIVVGRDNGKRAVQHGVLYGFSATDD